MHKDNGLINLRLGFPVASPDANNPDDLLYILVRSIKGDRHLVDMTNGKFYTGELRSDSGASEAYKLAQRSIPSINYIRLAFQTNWGNSDFVVPSELPYNGDSDGLACSLALAGGTELFDYKKDTKDAPLILISCSVFQNNYTTGLNGLKIGKVTNDDCTLGKNLDALKSKWQVACAHNALALVLHEEDALLLSQELQDGKKEDLQKNTFERLLKEQGKTRLISCKSHQIALLAEAMGIEPNIFINKEKNESDEFLFDLKQDNPNFSIQLWLQKEDTQEKCCEDIIEYYIGDKIIIGFESSCDCYLYLFNIDCEGDVTMLFPNKARNNNRITAKQSYQFPSDSEGFEFELLPPSGKDIIQAVATYSPLKLLDISELKELFFNIPKAKKRKIGVLLKEEVSRQKKLDWATAKIEFFVREKK